MSQKKQESQSLSDAYLYPPARAASVALTEFERRQNALYRLDWGIWYVDAYMTPMMAGDLFCLIGRPGHAKTSTLISFARRASLLARQLDQGGEDAVTVYVTWETTVQEFVGLVTAHESGQTLGQIARGQADLPAIRGAAIRAISDRCYVIGHSSETRTRVPLTLNVVCQLLDTLVRDGKTIYLITLDYLQRIPAPRPGMGMMERVVYNTDMSKSMALRYSCPVMVAVQSRRDADEYEGLRFPRMSDGQWSSTIEQDADKLVSLTRPCVYMAEGSVIKSEGRVYEITTRTLAVKFVKQRWAPAGKVFVISFDPETLEMGEAGYKLTDEPGKELPF